MGFKNWVKYYKLVKMSWRAIAKKSLKGLPNKEL